LVPTAGYYLAFIALGLVAASLGPTLAGLREQTATSLAQISLLFTVRPLGTLSGSFIGGRLFDRLPGHRLVVGVLLGLAVLLALVPEIPWLVVLIPVMFAIGFAEGAVDVGGNILLIWLHREKVGPFMNGLHFCFGLGAFIAPVVVAQALLHSERIDPAYRVLALLMLPAAAWLFRLPSPKPAANQAGAVDEAGNVFRPPENWMVFLFGLLFMLYVGAEVSYGGWVFSYAVARQIGDPATAAYLTSAFWGALTFGRLMAIPLSARWRPRTLLLVAVGGCLASAVLLLAAAGQPPGLWAGSLGLGLFMAPVFPTLLVRAERRMTITGRVTSWFYVGASLGAMTLPSLIGQLFEGTGPQVLLWFVMAAMTAELIMLLVVLRLTERRPLTTTVRA
jgi:MFS transporter, FHS family, Na+ dependent glucose transporter 1